MRDLIRKQAEGFEEFDWAAQLAPRFEQSFRELELVAKVRIFQNLMKGTSPPSSYEALFNCINKLHVLQQRPILSLYKEVTNIRPIEKNKVLREKERAAQQK
jgi:hypothetical protein